jgi:hypothetical protein
MKALLLAALLSVGSPAGVIGEVCTLYDVLPADYLPKSFQFCDPGLVIFICHDSDINAYVLLVWNEKKEGACEHEMERYTLEELERGFRSHGMVFGIEGELEAGK